MVNYNTGGTPENILGLGLKSATLADFAMAGTAYSLSAGLFVAVLCPLTAGQKLTSIGCVLDTAGVTSSGTTEMGLYTRAGVKVDTTGDMTTQFSGALGYITKALSAGVYTVPSTDLYYLTALTHFSGTVPKIVGCATAVSGEAFAPINARYSSIFFSAQASSPASFTPSGGTVNSAAYYLTAQ
jgi:hypothetical protein